VQNKNFLITKQRS